MDLGHIFLYQPALLDQPGEFGGSGPGAGVEHHAAHVLIQPVQGENIPAQLLPQSLGHIRFRV